MNTFSPILNKFQMDEIDDETKEENVEFDHSEFSPIPLGNISVTNESLANEFLNIMSSHIRINTPLNSPEGIMNQENKEQENEEGYYYQSNVFRYLDNVDLVEIDFKHLFDKELQKWEKDKISKVVWFKQNNIEVHGPSEELKSFSMDFIYDLLKFINEHLDGVSNLFIVVRNHERRHKSVIVVCGYYHEITK